ncbi:MAG: hypothetical protein ABEH90_07125 [Halolamina sp.]
MTEPPENRAVPAEWSEVTNPDHIIEKYDPRLPTLFEYEGGDIGVHILPDEPNTPHADDDAWRLGFVRGHRDNLEGAEPLVHCHGRDTAFHLAHMFMDAFNDATGDQQERVEAAKETVAAEAE